MLSEQPLHREASMSATPRHATPSHVCDELERALEFVGTSDIVVNAVYLRWLVEDARTLTRLIAAASSPELMTKLVRGEADVSPLEPSIRTLRPGHHLLAQLLAQGRGDTEVAEITGSSLSSILMLKSDPTFAELVSDYQQLWMRRPGKPN